MFNLDNAIDYYLKVQKDCEHSYSDKWIAKKGRIHPTKPWFVTWEEQACSKCGLKQIRNHIETRGE